MKRHEGTSRRGEGTKRREEKEGISEKERRDRQEESDGKKQGQNTQRTLKPAVGSNGETEKNLREGEKIFRERDGQGNCGRFN